jgi:hypothetical protein
MTGHGVLLRKRIKKILAQKRNPGNLEAESLSFRSLPSPRRVIKSGIEIIGLKKNHDEKDKTADESRRGHERGSGLFRGRGPAPRAGP